MILTLAQHKELQALLGPTLKLLDADTSNPVIETLKQRVGLFFEQDGTSVSYYLPTTNCCHPPGFDYDGTLPDLARKLTDVVS